MTRPRLEKNGELQANGYPLRSVVEELSTARAAAIVLLIDACRPLGFAGTVGKLRAIEVAQVVVERGMGPVLVGFSASPGQFALAGPAPSPFAAALAAEIVRPERRELAAVMGAVSRQVAAETGNLMRPSYLSSAPIYFRDGRGLVPGA